MKYLALLALLALAGCDRPAPDGYTFGAKEFTHTGSAIRFVIHPSIDDLRKAAPAAVLSDAGSQNRVLMAWSTLGGPDHGICTVHVVDPKVSYQPEWIGHEIAHCVWGRWHP